MQNEQMLPIAEVVRETGLSRSLIYRLITNGEFPAGVSMSLRRVAWPRSEVQQFIGRRIAAARGECRHAPIVQTLKTAAPGQRDDAHSRESASPLSGESELNMSPTIDIDRLLGRKPG